MADDVTSVVGASADDSASGPFVDGERSAFVLDSQSLMVTRRVYAEERSPGRLLIAEWMTKPAPDRAADVAWAARRSGLWSQLCDIWLTGITDDAIAEALATCGAFVDLPVEARRGYPLLTWAQAASLTVSLPLRTRHSAMMREVLKDAMTLHCQWQTYPSIDAAVIGGSVWLIAQKYLPGGGAERFDEAMMICGDLQRQIAESIRVGRPPSLIARLVFHVFAAQMLLSAGRVIEAHEQIAVGRLLGAVGYDMAWYLHGMERVIHASLGRPTPAVRGPVKASREVDTLGLGYFRAAGEGMALAAEAFLALRQLDRSRVEWALGALTPLMKRDSITASLAGAVEALSLAAWSEPERGLERLDEVAAAAVISGRGVGETFCGATLGAARARILAMIGATDLAYDLSADLPESLQTSNRAAALIWRGEFDEAAHQVEHALLAGDRFDGHRRQLVLLRLSALVAVMEVRDPELNRKCLVSVLACWEHAELLQFGLLPPGIRTAVLDAAEAAASDLDLIWLARLRETLNGLPVSRRPDRSTIKLTRREEVLLPLLASADSVPDIARRLHVSPNTLRKQVVTLREKFDAPNRGQLVRSARDMGFLSDIG